MTIMVGIDMHVKTLVCEIGIGRKKPKKKNFSNNHMGHEELIHYIEEMKQITIAASRRNQTVGANWIRNII